MGGNDHGSNQTLTQKPNTAIVDDPGGKPGRSRRAPSDKDLAGGTDDEAQIEEFGERGLGVAAKE